MSTNTVGSFVLLQCTTTNTLLLSKYTFATFSSENHSKLYIFTLQAIHRYNCRLQKQFILSVYIQRKQQRVRLNPAAAAAAAVVCWLCWSTNRQLFNILTCGVIVYSISFLNNGLYLLQVAVTLTIYSM